MYSTHCSKLFHKANWPLTLPTGNPKHLAIGHITNVGFTKSIPRCICLNIKTFPERRLYFYAHTFFHLNRKKLDFVLWCFTKSGSTEDQRCLSQIRYLIVSRVCCPIFSIILVLTPFVFFHDCVLKPTYWSLPRAGEVLSFCSWGSWRPSYQREEGPSTLRLYRHRWFEQKKYL